MYHPEYHTAHAGARLNWLRASVLGANDGIVSIAGLVFGVAGASASSPFLFATGVAGILAGALSMAVGEYVSVSSSRDAERALLAKEKFELKNYPDHELAELKGIYEKKGLSSETAETVAKELTAHDAFRAHVEAELNMDPDKLANPVQAALASAGSFFAGALIPFLAIILPPADIRLPVAFAAVVCALIATGAVSAWAGGANIPKAVIRVTVGGILAMAVTYGIGTLLGASV
jgi:VIT1/CCC1 family predicted Fe2+/Mn2+ transporter